MRIFEDFQGRRTTSASPRSSAAAAIRCCEEKLERINADLNPQDRRRWRSRTPARRLRPRRPRRRSQRASSTSRLRRLCAPRREHRACARSRRRRMSVGSNPDGGYLVPDELEREIGAAARRDLADPLDRRRARDLRQRLQEAVHDRGPRRRLGRRDRRARRRPTRRCSPSCRSRRWSSTPCRRRPRRCWRTPPSTSTSGSPPRSSRPSPCRKARPSSPATAPTSRRASSPTPRSPTPRGSGPRLGYIATGAAGASRRAIPPTCWSTSSMRLQGRLSPERAFVMNRKTQSGDPQVQGLRTATICGSRRRSRAAAPR